jgi:hypothetical protein
MAKFPRGLDAQQRAAIDLCPRLEKLFQVIWPKAKQYPTASECLHIANKLYIVKETRHPKKKQSSPALKHGRLLLQHLPSIRNALEASGRLYTVQAGEREFILDQLALDNCLSTIEIIEKLEQDVTAFLKACAPPKQSTPNSAAFIEDVVRMTWHSVEGARVPKANGPDDALCLFVTEALALIGKRQSRFTVSDKLRNRNDRQRKSDRPPLKNSRG